MRIKIDGLNLHYEITGESGRRDVVLLHGWGCDTTIFSRIAAALDDRFRVIRLDFPGFGKSDPPPAAMGVGDYSRLTEKFLNSLGCDSPILLGHSFGGRIIIYLTGKMGYRAERIILVDSAGILPKRSFRSRICTYVFKLGRGLIQLVYGKKADPLVERWRSRFGSADYNNASPVMRQVLVKTVNEDLEPYLASVPVPALLIWGSEDDATPLSDAKKMEALIPDAGLVVFQGRGHYSFLEEPSRFELIIKSFINYDGEGLA